MKIETIQGRLTATAETVQDMQTLLSLAKPKTPTKQEYKKACSLCGKRVKYLQLHLKNKHTPTVDDDRPY